MSKLLIPFIFIVVSCSGQNKKNDNYYFPVKDFFVSKTYCFTNQNDTTEKSFWLMETSVSNSDTLFQTSIFDSKNRITEIMIEKVINGISKIQSYTLYSYDNQGNKHSSICNIIDSLVFLAGQKINEEIQWQVNFENFSTPEICVMSKHRILTKISSDKETFSDLMRIEVINTKQGYQYSMTCIYEKRKGLIAYKQILPESKVKDFILKDIK